MNQQKPIIAVMPLYDEEKQSYWMLPGYMKSIQQQGAIPLMPPLTDDKEELDYFLQLCDGFLLTGGQDVSPSVYGRNITPQCGPAAPTRDAMDTYILTHAIENDKAVLGICRGIQIMNAVYGGTLYQDLPTEYHSDLEHHMSPPYDRAVHNVCIEPNTPLHALLQTDEIGVNSYHHQAVEKVADDFRVMAYASDHLVEGIYMPDKTFVWGVQWHPEFSYQTDANSRKILAAFLQAASKTNHYPN